MDPTSGQYEREAAQSAPLRRFAVKTFVAGRETGAAMLTVLIMVGIFTALAAGYSANLRAHVALRGRTSSERKGFYTAEGGLNVGVARFANIFRASGVPDNPDFHLEEYIGDRVADVELNPISGCNPCPPTTIPQGEMFAGLYSIPHRYTVQSRGLNAASQVEAHVAGQFDIHTVPIFQFLAFIDSHLFIMPLPDMTLHGRVHTNNDMFLQPDNDLRIEDDRPDIPDVQVTAAGDIYRGGYKYNASWRCWGDTYIDKLEDSVSPYNDLDPKKLNCGSSDPVPDVTLVTWKGSIKAGIEDILTPDPGIIRRGSGEYWQRADLRVVLRLDLPSQAIDFASAQLCPTGPGYCNGGLLSGQACNSNGDCPSSTCDFSSLTSPPLPVIEVQNGSGARDEVKTTALWRFMCERRGALFITDIPNSPPTPPNGDSAYLSNRFNYSPAFAAPERVYRRVGEDTSGNGTLTTADRNDDVCPPGPIGASAPWYKPPSCTWPLTSPGLSSWYRDMDYRRGGFWNHREQQWMNLLNLNARALIEWNAMNGDPLFPRHDDTDGGLVFFLSVAGPAEDQAVNGYGVRIFDSADLDMRNTTFFPSVSDPTGLSIVSDQGMIIQGNYNKKDKYPAALMSDAQWILSQGWEVPSPQTSSGFPNDLKSVFDLSTDRREVPSSDWPGGASFNSSSTFAINAAMLFGLGPSTLNPDWYNGGLENFPRFLEGWNTRTFNYRGSFVSLGSPDHKLAVWECGSGTSCLDGVYDPPVRAYDYDADFNKVEWLPPMTPKIVYVQQILYTRIYD
jgi:hypothetical protein